LTGHRPRAGEHKTAALGQTLRAEDGVGVQNGYDSLEVAVPRGGEEGVDNGPLPGEVYIRCGGPVTHPVTGTAGQLPRRGGSALNQRGNLLERHGEEIVQHEREPLVRRQGTDHHLQRKPHGIRHQGLSFRVGGTSSVDHRIRHA
jgi:hypothetical protein